MITHSFTSHIKKGITVRTYTCDSFADAAPFAKKYNGTIDRISNGTKHVYRIMI